MIDKIKKEIREKTKNIEWEFGYKDRKLICRATAFGVTAEYKTPILEGASSIVVDIIIGKISEELFRNGTRQVKRDT